MQNFEQKAVMLIGFAVLWVFIVIIVGRDSGWYTMIQMSIPIPIILGIVGIPLYKEWQILAKGECYAGTIIAQGQGFLYRNHCAVEIEFFINEEHYTTTALISQLAYESLTSAECTVYCVESHGRKLCLVRDFQYDKTYCSGGISLPTKPESELYARWRYAFSDKELAQRAEKQHMVETRVDYRDLYQ